MGCIDMDPKAATEIRKELSRKNYPPMVRLDLRSTGCCDASLCLIAQSHESSDPFEELDGLMVYMGQDIRNLTLGAAISYIEGEGYYIRSKQPLNEWDGFAPSRMIFEDS